jgi:hypothetical protein
MSNIDFFLQKVERGRGGGLKDIIEKNMSRKQLHKTDGENAHKVSPEIKHNIDLGYSTAARKPRRR